MRNSRIGDWGMRRHQMNGGVHLACFDAAVLNAYRRREDCVLRNADGAGCLETPRWSLEFRVAPDGLVYLPERDLWRLEPAESAHWYSFLVAEYDRRGTWYARTAPEDSSEHRCS
jgi:hypothetical protein